MDPLDEANPGDEVTDSPPDQPMTEIDLYVADKILQDPEFEELVDKLRHAARTEFSEVFTPDFIENGNPLRLQLEMARVANSAALHRAATLGVAPSFTKDYIDHILNHIFPQGTMARYELDFSWELRVEAQLAAILEDPTSKLLLPNGRPPTNRAERRQQERHKRRN